MRRWTPAIRVRGHSMRPTLRDGQIALVLPRWRPVRVGDIVVLVTRDSGRLVKRVAAGPGSLVELEAGRLYVDGRAHDGLPRVAGPRIETWRVPSGHVFVVGDNLRRSDDSRVWSEPFVPVGRIAGLVPRGRQGPRRPRLRTAHVASVDAPTRIPDGAR